jgi:nucleoside-diphosphate-sugar epimerase
MSGHEWRDCRVLVTGARGFIASHLRRRLVSEGAQVFGVSRARRSDSDIVWAQVDLTNRDAVRRLMTDTRPDVVFHLAGHVTGSQHVEQIDPTVQMNLVSTVHVMTVALEVGRPRVVLAGSMHEPEPGDPAGVPSSPYAASKWACSGYARMFHALYQLPVVIAVPFMVYGPAQWDLRKLLPYVITSLLQGKSPRVSNGNQAIDWIYIDDVVSGLLLIARSNQLHGRSIDFGTGRLVTIRELIERVIRVTGANVGAAFGAVPDRPLEQPRTARLDDTHRLTGWLPATSLDDGLEATVAWYRTHMLHATV